ncbi:MAG: hypothetical protein ABGY11_10390 [Candidatus Thioglobus sp.]|jgi:hypothetical protein
MFYINAEHGIAYKEARHTEYEEAIDDDIANLHLYGVCIDETAHPILDTTYGILTEITRGDN